MRLLPAFVGDLRAVVLCGLMLAVGTSGWAAKWDPVPAADLAATASATFPGADAEILLSEHSQSFVSDMMMDGGAPTGIQYYNNAPVSRVHASRRPSGVIVDGFVRMKIYTAKGAGELRRVIVEQMSEETPSDGHMVAPLGKGTFGVDRCGGGPNAWARVVKPDGRSRELAGSAIQTRADGEVADRLVSLDFPELEPGDVVEFRWTGHGAFRALGRMIPCQQALPVREYQMIIKHVMPTAEILTKNCPRAEQSKVWNGIKVVVRDLPAFETEPFMPGLWDHRVWISPPWSSSRDEWLATDKRWSDDFSEATKPSKVMKAKAGELIAGAATEDEKLRRLYEYCRSEIENADWVCPPVGQENEKPQRARKYRSANKADIVRGGLADRVGDAETIDLVFAALARGAGFSVRRTRSAERFFLATLRENLGRDFLNRNLVAVEVGGQWRFCSPGRRVIPYGMIPAIDEDVPVLCSGSQDADLPKRTPVAAAALSQAQRKARLHLDAEGTLAGEVEEALTGHSAITLKQRFGREAEADAAELAATEWLRGEVKRRLPGAEISAMSCANLRSVDLPVTIKYHVRVPAYARKTGGALQLPPSYFESGELAVFPAAERKYPISFPHAWSELDDVEIALPEGFAVVGTDAPAPLGDAKVLGVSYRMEYNKETRSLRYFREFAVGGNGAISFKVEAYPTLKKFFDHVHGADAHTLVLAPVAVPAP